ncbi:helix-turn-helix domain-containing protein [Nocardia alni]|uniref:helix-turn-helix domain-containing protein n=1 Tax=Nocardia alni TaxID=2815723 RepID=UPI001C22AFA0|nr:XRE family transcriptional regulator [Nocardia alni]
MNIARQIGHNTRRLREAAGRSLADLATSAGLSKTTLHAIEQGEANPTLSTLWSLATELEVPLGTLLDSASPEGTVVRAGEGPRVAGESVHARLLHRIHAPGWIEVYELDVTSDRQHSRAHLRGVEECLIVTRGRVETGPSEAPTTLDAGDSVHFDAAQPHVYQGLEDANDAILIMIHH